MAKKIILIIFLYMCHATLAVDIGSDVIVSNFTTPQFVHNGDRIANLAFIRGGMYFDGINTTATWDSHFALSGNIALNGGTVILNDNVFIAQPSSILSIGNIVGNRRRIEFAPSPQIVPSISDIFLDCGVLFVDNETLVSSIRSCDWTDDDQYLAVGMQTTATSILRIYQVSEQGFILTDEKLLNNQTVSAVRWHPTQNFLAVGTVVNPSGGEFYLFDFDSVTGTLTQTDEKEIGADVRAISWHQINGEFIALGTNDASQEIQLWSFDATTSQLGTSPLISIDLMPDRAVSFGTMDWNATSTLLAVGLNAVASEPSLLIYEFDATNTLLTLIESAVTGTAVTALEWNSNDANILGIGLAGGAPDLVRVYEFNSTTSVVTQIAQITGLDGSILSFDWGRSGAECVVIGKSNDDSTGTTQFYFFDSTTNTFMQTVNIPAPAAVDTVRWSHAGVFIASGDLTGILSLYESAESFLQTTCFVFSDVDIVFNDDFSVDRSCILYQDNCLLDSHNHYFDFGPSATFIIDNYASLMIGNQVMTGLSGTKIQCRDMTSTLTLVDTTLILDGDFTFTQGRIDIIGKVKLETTNNAKFIYMSEQPLTIQSNAKLVLDEDVTFSYAPLSGAPDLLRFADSTAVLEFKGGDLHTTGTLHLTKGTIRISTNAHLSTSSIDYNIVFGSGDAVDDLICIILRDQALRVTQGVLSYKNVLSSSWQMFDTFSTLHMFDNTQLQIYETINLNKGRIEFDEDTILAVASGKDVIGSIFPYGRLRRTVL